MVLFKKRTAFLTTPLAKLYGAAVVVSSEVVV